MGSIRSRRKKLTTLLTDVNTRLKSVELRSIGQQAADAANEETDENFVTPGSYINSIAPATWKRVIGGWYYPKRVTGLANDRVELFLNVDAGLEKDEFLEASGINTPVNVSKKRKVLGTGQVVGDYRNNKSWYQPIPAGATHALLYSVGAEPNFSSARALNTRAPISSFSATTTVATINFSTAHNFNQGDVINISDLGGNMAGIDGLFFVDTVPSTTSITYKFSEPLEAPIANTPATANKYVYATVHEAVNIGDSWINTATDPDSLYIWNGLRWIAASDPSSVKKDDKDPGAPTNLQVSTVAYPNDGGDTRASATFSWTAPTTNADGTPLTDLGGYDVEWSGPTITGADGTKWARDGGYAFVDTSIDISDLPAGQTVRFRVRTIDTGGRKSEWAAINKLMGTRSDVLTSPSAPQVTTRLGTVTVRWNGLQSNGSVPPNYLNYLEVHVSSTSNFTPSTATLSGRIDKSGNDFYVITDLPYNQSRYVRLVFVDKDGKKSLPSTQVLITIKPLVDTDIIGKILDGANIVPGSITASESIIGNTITGNLIQALTIRTGNLEANLITADKINVGAVEATAIKANAITAEKINVGAITAVKIAANAITADKINAGAITAVKISSSAITTDKINAGAITADKIRANTITASQISATGIIGRTLSTAASGQRVVVSSSGENYIRFYNSSALQGVLTTNGDSELVFQRSSGTGSGRVRLKTTYAELAAGSNSIGVCGINQAYVIANSARQVRLGSDLTGVASGLFFNFPQYDFSTGGDRYVIIDYNGKVKWLSSFPSNLSDARLKNVGDDKPLGLDFISKLNPVSFKWKPETRLSEPNVNQFGLIAQEVEQALSESGIALADQQIVTSYGDDSYTEFATEETGKEQMRTINYIAMVPILIKSNQELLAKIEELQAEVVTLKESMTDGN